MSGNKKELSGHGEEYVVIELPIRLKNQLTKTASKKNLSLNEECYRRLLCSIERELQAKEALKGNYEAKKMAKVNWMKMIFNPDCAFDKKKRRKK